MSAAIKIFTVIYVFILAAIVFLADRRGTRHLLSFVGHVPFGDKIGHFLLMGTLSLLVNLAFRAKSVAVWKFGYLLGSLLVSAVVALEEFSQIFVRGRSFDWADLVSDFVGIVIFGEAARLVCRAQSGNDCLREKT